MAPASATPTVGASGHKTAAKAVVTGIEPAAPAASTDKDDDYVYIRVLREKVAQVDTGRTETVQHHVSQSAGPQNAAPVLESVPVQLPAPTSQQWLGDSSTISYARVSVLQPGGSGYTSGDTVDTEPHLVVLTRHVAGRYHTHLEAFRHALLGDPPARLEPMTVRLQPGSRAVRAPVSYTHLTLPTILLV